MKINILQQGQFIKLDYYNNFKIRPNSLQQLQITQMSRDPKDFVRPNTGNSDDAFRNINQFYAARLATRPPGFSHIERIKRQRDQRMRIERQKLEANPKANKQENQKSNYVVFDKKQNQQQQVSQRVQKARQDHRIMLENLERRTKPIIKEPLVNPQKINETIQEIAKAPLQIKEVQNNLVSESSMKPQLTFNLPSLNSGNLFKTPTYEILQTKQVPSQHQNNFKSLESRTSQEEKIQPSKSNIFGHKNTSSNQSQTLFQNPLINNLTGKNIFVNKTQTTTQNPIFSSNSNNFIKYQISQPLLFSNNNNASNSIFSLKSVQQPKQSQMKSQPQIFKQKVKPPKQSNHQQSPQKTSPIKIFAQGLFDDNGKQKQKPTLIFNNNVVKPIINTNQSNNIFSLNNNSGSFMKAQPPKLLFNNNGATVDKLKPSVNIFGGSISYQNEQKVQVQSQKMEIQKQPAKPFFNLPPQQIAQIQQQNTNMPNQNVFGAMFKSNQSNQKKEEPQPEPKQQQQMTKVSLFSNQMIFNNTPTPQPQKTQNKSHEKVNVGLFASNPIIKTNASQTVVTPSSNSLFSSNNNKSDQHNSTPTGGLFGNNNNNKFNPVMTAIPEQKSSSLGSSSTKTKGLFEQNKQTSNQTPGLFGSSASKSLTKQTLQPNQGLFAKPQQLAKSNPFTTPAPSNNPFLSSNHMFTPAQQQTKKQDSNPFKKPASTNSLFSQPGSGNIFTQPSQPNNLFSQNTGTVNMFRTNNGQSSSLFGTTQGSSLFDKPVGLKGAALFSKKNQEDQDSGGQGQQDDDLVQDQSPEVTEGQMKFNYDQPQIIFPRSQVVKFKDPFKSDSAIQNVKISLQKLPKNNQVYMIVRTPNKQPIFIGFFMKVSVVRLLTKPGAVAIEKMIQLKQSTKKATQQSSTQQQKKSSEEQLFVPTKELKILFKNQSDAKTFQSACNKIINSKQ